MEKIRVCLYVNTIVFCPGETIGIYTVAPSVICRGGEHRFTGAAYSVRAADSGMTIAAFFEKQIARNFAQMLVREYGEISETLRHCFERCETVSDKELLDRIQQQSFHASRVRKNMIVPYIHISNQVLLKPEQSSRNAPDQPRNF